MQRIFHIVGQFKEYLIFAILIVVSLILLSLNDNRQIRAIRSYTVGFIGVFQNAISIIPNVVELARENTVLRQLNVNLSDEVNRLREARLENLRLRALLGLKEHSTFQLIAADVIGKSLHLLRNTITVNVGEAHGVKNDMPIISESGLVGKVIATSTHYAIGQLMVNKDFRASGKIQRSRVDGIITWNGGKYLQLKNVAKAEDVQVGDVLITSEYSNMFPPDITVGTVANVSETPGTLFKHIDILPSVEFASLEQVFVILTTPDSERVALESKFLPAR